MRSLLFSLSLLTSLILFSQKINSGADVIRGMYNKYNGGKKWYKHFSFTQDAIFYRNDSVIKKEVWHEIGSFPGYLAIKYNTKDSKDGVIFAANKVYRIKDGIATEPKVFIHDLILVCFDIYFLPPDRSIQLLDSLGYNLKEVREAVFEGRKVFVVGAKDGDNKTPQFWIDAERFYLHRIVYAKKNNVTDCVFSGYKLVNHNWVSTKVIFKSNGRLQLIELYYDLKFPKKIDLSVFDPKKFTQLTW